MKCPCDAKRPYLSCCGQFITHQSTPATPEELMRSRYSAYALKHFDYIIETMCGPALNHFDLTSAQNATQSTQWIKLDIISDDINILNINQGFVEFKAYCRRQKSIICLHEKSEFRKINHQWFYYHGHIFNNPSFNI